MIVDIRLNDGRVLVGVSEVHKFSTGDYAFLFGPGLIETASADAGPVAFNPREAQRIIQ